HLAGANMRAHSHIQFFHDPRKLRADADLRPHAQAHGSGSVDRGANRPLFGMDDLAAGCSRFAIAAANQVQPGRNGERGQQASNDPEERAAHSYCFFSKTITSGALVPRTDSTLIVLPSADSERVSVRTTLLPATAPALVHVVTSLLPSHLLTVSLVPLIGT